LFSLSIFLYLNGSILDNLIKLIFKVIENYRKLPGVIQIPTRSAMCLFFEILDINLADFHTP